jgi:hypothetical protein
MWFGLERQVAKGCTLENGGLRVEDESAGTDPILYLPCLA